MRADEKMCMPSDTTVRTYAAISVAEGLDSADCRIADLVDVLCRRLQCVAAQEGTDAPKELPLRDYPQFFHDIRTSIMHLEDSADRLQMLLNRLELP